MQKSSHKSKGSPKGSEKKFDQKKAVAHKPKKNTYGQRPPDDIGDEKREWNGKKAQMAKSVEASALVAQYYGFSVIKAPTITKDDYQKVKSMLEIDLSKQDGVDEHELAIYPEEKVALLRTYLDQGMTHWSQPAMLYHEDNLSQISSIRKKKLGSTDEKIFHLDILGSTKSIAEATLIKTTFEILREEGFADLIVRINSIGDRDSMSRFCRDLGNYYRKNIETMSPHCRQIFKKDPYDAFECKEEKCQAIKEKAPATISYLTEQNRQHFCEVLEYLETLEIPYKIDNTLVCSKKMWSQTAFEIREANETNTLLAVGMRYNSISKKLGFRKELGAIGATIAYKKVKAGRKEKAKAIKSPKIYFIQLGFDAKLKSLKVIEMLRQADIPLTQSLGRDKIGGQIQSAENSNIPYMIIMGQKEAHDDTVIVREMNTRSQEIVSLSILPTYLKKIK